MWTNSRVASEMRSISADNTSAKLRNLFFYHPYLSYPKTFIYNPDSKVHGANMGPTWVLLAPDGPHVGPMNLAMREIKMS